VNDRTAQKAVIAGWFGERAKSTLGGNPECAKALDGTQTRRPIWVTIKAGKHIGYVINFTDFRFGSSESPQVVDLRIQPNIITMAIPLLPNCFSPENPVVCDCNLTRVSGYRSERSHNALSEGNMEKYGFVLLAASSLAAITVSQPAAAATELCPGPALVGGSIQNGSSCSLEATGATVTELFVGVSAKDTDILNLGSTQIFNNQTTAPGTTASQTVTTGSTLNFSLNNTNDILGPATYDTGTGYTNAVLPFGISNGLSPVYHFAWFDITNSSDFNSLFGPKVTMPSAVNSYLLSNGGYSDWLFVGVEDSQVDTSDDWNDTIYAFQNVAPVGSGGSGGGSTVPEPSTWAMMLAGFAGLGFVGYRARKPVAAVA
jgi:hypothetical protein